MGAYRTALEAYTLVLDIPLTGATITEDVGTHSFSGTPAATMETATAPAIGEGTYGARFNGSTDGIYFAHNVAFDSGTFIVWFKTTTSSGSISTNGGTNNIIGFDSTSGSKILAIGVGENGQLQGRFGGNYDTYIGPKVDDGEWHMLTLAFASASKRWHITVDGVWAGGGISVSSGQGTPTLSIGGNSRSNNHYTGDLFGFALISEELTDAQAKTLYETTGLPADYESDYLEQLLSISGRPHLLLPGARDAYPRGLYSPADPEVSGSPTILDPVGVYFDGVDDGYRLNPMFTRDGSETIMFWYKGTAAGGTNLDAGTMVNIIQSNSSSSNKYMGVGIQLDGKAVWFADPGYNEQDSTTIINDNAWHHVAVVLSGTADQLIYIDGVQEATNTTDSFSQNQPVYDIMKAARWGNFEEGTIFGMSVHGQEQISGANIATLAALRPATLGGVGGLNWDSLASPGRVLA